MKRAKKGYICADGKTLNIIGDNINGLYEEPYISSIQWLNFVDVSAHKIVLDYSVFKSLKKLSISSSASYVFPKEICYLPNLEEIYCNAKCLIPPEIGEMSKLWRLELSGDCVLNMPESIKNVSTLRDLILGYDGEIMPSWITNLPQLEQLYFHYCNFTDIDPNINNLSKLHTLCFWNSLSNVNDFPTLAKLKYLERLEVSGGSFMRKRPPYSLLEKVLDSISPLDTLRSLGLFDWKSRKKGYHLVVNERGRSIPDIFNLFPKLYYLDLSYLDIDFLPSHIFELPLMETIVLNGNNISEDCLGNLRKLNIRYII
jgi:Leucine-rich repeat (LRR) protein